MRATRNFSGRAAGMERKRRMPGYAREILEKRAEGRRIGLLMVAVDDWNGGWYFRGKPNVERVVCPEDFDFSGADFSVASGCDVLVCGEGAPERLNLATLACLSAGAASVWGEYNDGLWRTTFWPHEAPYLVCEEGSVSYADFAAKLAAFREREILLEAGGYGKPEYRPVRMALLARLGLAEAV